MKINKKTIIISLVIFFIISMTTIVSATVDNDTTQEITPPTYEYNHITEKTGTKNNIKDENLKTMTKNVEVNNYVELITAINTAINDSNSDEYIINLNEGTYDTKYSQLEKGTYQPNIIINANNQSLTGDNMGGIFLNNSCNITIIDAQISFSTDNHINLTIKNSVLDGSTNHVNPLFYNYYANVSFINSTINGSIENYQGNISFINSTINERIKNNGNVSFINSTLNKVVENEGILIINDDVIFGNNCVINNNGIIINNSEKFVPYLEKYNGTFTLEKIIINKEKRNYGNITIIDSIINETIYNHGNLTVKNSIVNQISYEGQPLIPNNGNISFINSTINGSVCLDNFHGYIYFINSTLNGGIDENSGKIYFINSTINGSIENYDTIIINDDSIFGESFNIINYTEKRIIINDTEKIIPYFSRYDGICTLENMTITCKKDNYGNLTIKNSTLKDRLYNYGTLIINDDVIFEKTFSIDNRGEIIINNTEKLIPYLNRYNGTYTVENVINTNTKYNYGNLTIINSSMNYPILNYGNLTMKNSSVNGKVVNFNDASLTIINSNINNSIDNRIDDQLNNSHNGNVFIYNCTINGSINFDGNLTISNSIVNGSIGSDYGILTINNNVTFGESCKIDINEEIIINDTKKIIPYLNKYNGTYLLENSIIHMQKSNYGNLTIKNSIINETIRNNGTLIINDDVILGERCRIINYGEIITNNSDKLLPYMAEYNETLTLKNTYVYGLSFNYGNLTIDNSTIKGTIYNNGNLIINESDITQRIQNNENANLTIINSAIVDNLGTEISNYGTLILKNMTLKSKINNRGTLIIDDDCIIYPRFYLTGSGTIVSNKTNEIRSENQSYLVIKDIVLDQIIIVNKTSNITVLITNEKDEEINGTLSITDGEVNITSNNKKVSYKPLSFGEKKLTITFTDLKNVKNKIETTINITVYPIVLSTNIIKGNVNEIINITARITAKNYTMTNINKGKITFKVNGKTLKDTNGKVIYAKVINGTATIENYIVPESWNKDNLTIEAVYSGSTQCDSLRSEKQNITMNKAQPTFTTEDVTATISETITLKASITDGDKVINNGKIVFKINGKTLKDANGKVIYAQITNNQANITYTIPTSYKAKSYTLTATLISNEYDRLTDTKTLTITA